MKKALNLLKIFLFICLLIAFVWLMSLRLFYLQGYSYLWEEYFYIWLLLTLLYCVWVFKLNSIRILKYSIFIYILGSILVIMNLNSLAEFWMRSSIIGFIIGTTIALIEYRKGNL